MKLPKLIVGAATVFLLAACSIAQAKAPIALSPSAVARPRAAEDHTEADARQVVEDFGKQLQMVSLLSPTASQDIKEKYSPFVTSELLEKWTNDPSAAPGRVVSSPWPDRIEISEVVEQSPGQYLVTGDIIEITSTELSSGKAANRIPVMITVEEVQGRWLISAFEQKPAGT